jgi:general secretion pathway protein N
MVPSNAAGDNASASLPPLPPDPSFAMPPEESFAAVLERPVFSPTRRSLPSSGVAATLTTSAAFLLVGVVISGGERFVLVKPLSSDGVERLREGDELAGWSTVAIEPDRVLFRRGALEEEIVLDYTAPAPPTPRPNREKPTTARQPDPGDQATQPPDKQPQDEPESDLSTTPEASGQ